MKIISTTPPSPPLKREGPKRTCTKPLRFRDSTAPEPQRSPTYKLEPIKAVSLGPNHQALCPENLASKAEAVASAVHEKKKKVVIRGPKQQPIWPENVASEGLKRTCTKPLRFRDSTAPEPQRSPYLPPYKLEPIKAVSLGPNHQALCPENLASKAEAVASAVHEKKKKVVIRGPKQQPIWPENVASEGLKRTCTKPLRFRDSTAPEPQRSPYLPPYKLEPIKAVSLGPNHQALCPENLASKAEAVASAVHEKKKKVVIRGPKQQPIWPENVASEDAASANSDNCAAKVRNMPKRSCGKPSRYLV